MATRRTASRSRSSEGSVCLVKVARVGGQVQEFALNGDRTVRAALGLADITIGTGMRVRVGGTVADLDKTLRNGDVVTVAEKVQGGR